MKLEAIGMPESFGLLREYYTPTALAESIAELAGNGSIVHTREPNAGIGRLIRAFNPRRCLALEAWGQMERVGLVIANPPYGERGVTAHEDPDPADNEKRPLDEDD